MITLGVIFTATLKNTVGSSGIVLIALGSLFFVIGMNKS